MWHLLAHLFLHGIGADNLSGPEYGFWSGFGSDIAEFALLGGIATIVRQHNCEVHGCWRLGRHTTNAGHRVCRVHHPDEPLTVARVRMLHHRHSGERR
jgi:hypothetical protein